MHELLFIMAGLLAGGAAGVAAMCLVQVTHCADCPYRRKSLNRDGK